MNSLSPAIEILFSRSGSLESPTVVTAPPPHEAKVLRELDDDVPWYTEFSYVEALAALARVHSDELQVKTFVKGTTLKHILWCAAAPERIQWFF